MTEQTFTTDLGDGYTLRSIHAPGSVRARAMGNARAFGDDAFMTELADAGLRPGKEITLPPAPVARTRDLTGGAGLAVPPEATLSIAVGEDESCVLLVEDSATGAVSWIIADNASEGRDSSGARGLATTLHFTIPQTAPVPVDGVQRARGFAEIGKKIQSFLFKVTDALLGPIIHGFARKWETKHRPTFVRAFGPDDYQNDDPGFPRLDEAGWQRLGKGRALLFVHGTFSTCGAFAPLAPAVMAELSRRYEGRIFAFNHPTMTADPRDNALAFLSSVPDSVKLDVDIVCHSRGGLVARQIALLGEGRSVSVRRIVFVGATNAGTALADDAHMVQMIDRFTTIAKFIPAGTARKIVDALVLVIKVIGHGFLAELEGLAAMNPRGTFMKALNVPGGTPPDFFAIASDFEPKADTPFFSLTRAEDLAVDRIFENAANDLVVPRDGVFSRNGAGGFPIGDGRCLHFGPADGVIHTEFFSEPRVGAKLVEWLEPTTTGQRAFTAGPSIEEIARTLDAFRDHALATLRSQGASRDVQARATTFTPAELEALRPHVVNLSEGLFKQSGTYSTTEGDVDAIVREHIPAWAAKLPAGEPLRIAVWAHGGLIGESDGLKIALKHVEWWKKNGVYPLYFVWETGLFDALRSILEAVARKIPGLGTRDIFDFTTDPLVQEGVRALGGVHVWGAMKSNASLAIGANGGARYVAARLGELSTTPALIGDRPLELHAVGHSAGSIFHSWFLPTAKELQLPRFKTLQLLAPAITIADFEERLSAQLRPDGVVERAVMYTMKKSFEEDDHCIRVYRKSLLYLIHHALEPARRTPILGLEINVRASAAVSALFGLNGAGGAPGRVVWSETDDGDGRSSSRSKTHGGFDDDPLTMNSVVANVLNEQKARVAYVGSEARAFDGWPSSDDWLAGIDVSAVGAGAVLRPATGPAFPPSSAGSSSPGPTGPVSKPSKPTPPSPAGNGGVRRALCVGIDAYPGPNALSGCVNDTTLWGNALTAVGFNVDKLTDQRATHSGIVNALRELVMTSKSGDVLVFQFSGHGTRVPDIDGDEGPDGDGNDQAFVPVDFEDGAFLIDDDVRALFDLLPAGVNLTVFADCCHSGTITRILGRNSDFKGDPGRARFLKKTGEWEDWMRAHARFRDHANATRALNIGTRGVVDRNALRWVNYSACLMGEVALEHNGNGDFTRQTTPLLTGDLSRFTHRSLQDAVIAAFGERRQQTPQLDCPDSLLDRPLLQPLA